MHQHPKTKKDSQGSVLDGVKFSPVPQSEDNSRDYLCGLGNWRPRWLQFLACSKSYLVIFCILGILQGAYFTYIIGIISTVEKRYAFESKVSGLILIADNLSPILTSTLIGYFGGQSHRPHWVAGGMLFVVFSCFLSAVPYYMYGPGTHLLSESQLVVNSTNYEFCDATDKEADCATRENWSTIPSVSILFIASFLNGFGYTAFYSIGTSYLDDNVKKKNSPLYFSTLFSLRMFGPSLGFLLSSFSLNLYEDPFYDPGISRKDPRWIGAWWIGFLILGSALLIFTIPMFLYPKHLPKKGKQKPVEERKLSLVNNGNVTTNAEKEDQGKMRRKSLNLGPKIRELPNALKRLAKNPIFVCHTISAVLHINGVAGYYIYMPRYMETQFRQSASSASLFSGSTSLISLIAGIMLGGLLIQKFRPRPRYLTGYMVILELGSILTFFIVMLFSCSPLQLNGTFQNNKELILTNECNSHCGCTNRVFQPVCGPNETSTYFSPCYAGCGWKNITSGVFEDCKCVHEPKNEEFVFASAKDGFCSDNCNSFLPYIIILSIGKFFSSTGRVGNTLIVLRAVDPKDKSLALGALGAVFSLFAFIPYPLVYGAIADACCLVWEKSCGTKGNCWLYDIDKFRYLLHGVTIAFCVVATVFDFMVFLYSGRFKNFYEDEEPATENGFELPTKQPPEDAANDDVKEANETFLVHCGPMIMPPTVADAVVEDIVFGQGCQDELLRNPE